MVQFILFSFQSKNVISVDRSKGCQDLKSQIDVMHIIQGGRGKSRINVPEIKTYKHEIFYTESPGLCVFNGLKPGYQKDH